MAAGSRREGPGSDGVANLLAKMAFKSTEDRTALAIKRTSEMVGASLEASNDRESIYYTASFLRDDLNDSMDNLADAVNGQQFFPWELSEAKDTAEVNLGETDPSVFIMDALHSGAFRATLGRPSVCPPYKVSAITVQDLSEYAATNYTAGNITIFGKGVDHDSLVAKASASSFASVAAEVRCLAGRCARQFLIGRV